MQSRTYQKCEIAYRLWRDNLEEGACCLSQQDSRLKTVASAEMFPLPHRIAGFRRPRRHQIELGGLLYGDSLRMRGAMSVSTLLLLTIEVACKSVYRVEELIYLPINCCRPNQRMGPRRLSKSSGSIAIQLDQAGFTSPALSLSANISGSERPLTTDISRSLSSVSAKCSLVASMALEGAAMATLK